MGLFNIVLALISNTEKQTSQNRRKQMKSIFLPRSQISSYSDFFLTMSKVQNNKEKFWVGERMHKEEDF
jgi:hypothetical protein